MGMNLESLIGESGPIGPCGPNDLGYMVARLNHIREFLKEAASFYVGYSHARNLTEDHPLFLMMQQCRALHECYAYCTNEKHDPELFEFDPILFMTPAEAWKQ